MLGSYFWSPFETAERPMLNDFGEFYLLVDVHNSEVFKSAGKGHVSMKVTSGEAFVNQVRKSRV